MCPHQHVLKSTFCFAQTDGNLLYNKSEACNMVMTIVLRHPERHVSVSGGASGTDTGGFLLTSVSGMDRS